MYSFKTVYVLTNLRVIDCVIVVKSLENKIPAMPSGEQDYIHLYK